MKQQYTITTCDYCGKEGLKQSLLFDSSGPIPQLSRDRGKILDNTVQLEPGDFCNDECFLDYVTQKVRTLYPNPTKASEQ